MIVVLSFITISLISGILGLLQVIGKKQRSALSWYFFAICVILTLTCFGTAILHYSVFTEEISIYDSIGFIIWNVIIVNLRMLIVPFFFAFILSLSKIKLKRFKIIQRILFTINILIYSILVFFEIAFSLEKISDFIFKILNPYVLLVLIFSFCCLIYLQYIWIINATRKRDRSQAMTTAIAGIISLFSIVAAFLLYGFAWLEIISFIGAFAGIIILNHHANQYNNLNFNVSNLANYVYSAVKLPVLILDDSGDIMLCNTASESFFKKSAEQLGKLKVFDLFNFENVFSLPLHRKMDELVLNCDATCSIEGQKCQISFNYVYDKFDEMICTVVIVTDITEKEELIRQLNESHVQIEQYNQNLQKEVDRQTESIRNLQEAILYSISDLIEKKDGYTGGHTRRVSGYVAILLHELARRGYSLTDSDIQHFAKSSLLHDMGKIAIPDNILLKNGKLTDIEFNVMKSHSSVGSDSLEKSIEYVKDNDFLKNAFEMAKYHHEKWDGSGYPDGKKGTEIPLLARVMAIADVYDALRSKRPYKEPFDREKTKSIIMEERGRHFDPELVDIFLTVEPEFNKFCEADKWK